MMRERTRTMHAVSDCAQRWALAAVVCLALGGAATGAHAAEALACDAQHILTTLQVMFQHSVALDPSSPRWKATEHVKETAYGTPPPFVNQYTPAPDYFHKSRFCEATIRFQDDHTETAWYRIDALKDGDEQEFNFDLCTLPTDVFQNQCEHARPPKH
jgi:hypothetical protein